MYRLIPLRVLRQTTGVKFNEIPRSDIPRIDGVDQVFHGPNSISPGSVEESNPPCKRPWYMHSGQDDNLMVLKGTRYIDIYCPEKKVSASFIVTPDKVYKNDKLYYDGPAMVVWPAGIFHRIISGEKGSISLNFSTRTNKFNIDDNFNIFSLDTSSGSYECIRDGKDDQPDLNYAYPSEDIKSLVKSK
jgi:hypothetical protein